MTRPLADPDERARLADAVEHAINMLDSEEHRYVERFAPCPNGCVYDYADGATVDGVHRDWPPNTPPILVRVDGPADCPLCDTGTVEDDDAPWLNDDLDTLRRLLTLLRGETDQ